jgi:hypothetical protein
MADLKRLTNKAREVVVDIDGEELTVRYAPGRISTEQLIAIEAAEASGRLAAAGPAYAEFLATVIVDWDLYDGKAKYPHTAEALLRLPIGVLGAIAGAITRDMGGNSAPKAGSSSDGS